MAWRFRQMAEMGQERGVIAWMANNPVAANLLMLVVMIGGLAAINNLTKEVFSVLSH